MYEITAKEKNYLRELAKRQMEYARLPAMNDRKLNWVNLNTGKLAIPPVVVETDTFIQNLMPPGTLRCTNQKAREMEYRLLKTILEYEQIDDDKVVPDFYEIPYKVELDEFGFPIEEEHALDPTGRDVGFRYHSPIKDLEQDFDKLRPAKIFLNRIETAKEEAFAQEILDEILPVRKSGNPPMLALTWKAVQLLGLEKLLIYMYEEPELVHKLMKYLMENQIAVMEFYEKNRILTANSGNQQTGASSFGFLDMASDLEKGYCTLKDIWIWAESEEMSSVSPEMFRELCLPYVAEAAKRVGKIYYGCCEPMENNWEAIYTAMPHIGKVSVAPWTDQAKMGDFLRGTEVVFSRKPFANYLGVAQTLDEDAWRLHIRETMEAAKGCQCEIIMRDIYQVPCLEMVRRAVGIAREEAFRYYG